MRRAFTLAAVLLTLLTLPTSVTGSGVALAHIGRDVQAPLDALQWVVHAYNLTFACFMLACGSLGDLYGRRRVFAAGAVTFGAASLVSAVTTDVLLLDLARGVAGAGAAALLTSGSAVLSTTFDGKARDRVFAALGIVTGAGLALGAMAAGTLADSLGWRWFFGAHALLMVPVLAAVPAMRESRSRTEAQVDWPGTGTFVGGLLLLMLGTVEGPQWGWGSPGVLGLFAGAAVLLAAFVLVERRRRHPMLDLELLRNKRFMGLCLIPVVVSFSFVVLLPLFPNYLMVANGLDSRAAGATMLLMTVPILVAPILAGRLVGWGLPTRTVFALSLACLTAGLIWLTLTLTPGMDATALAGPLITLGIGLGLNFGLVDGAVLTTVPPTEAGTAAGFLNTLRLGSEAVAIAATGAALVNLTRTRLPSTPSPKAVSNSVNAGDITTPLSWLPHQARPAFLDAVAQSITGAWQLVLWSCAAICALLSITIWVLLAQRTEFKALKEQG
ncbi:hypothetical protein DP939_22045 [Spongiactinospora rosea]|uniref:Major facilitator superfamily (MFS) profile domain-containing protein n=1 Tax=Spongiactinospora rosea TaxID=2248750 RepID=A0A366LXG6_9ACTN|nr:MFS transporter [Spongiactinospora rosea]RBQ18049.1 hypothetical protein DP939_22045 [Spongiactinospora rosea]